MKKVYFFCGKLLIRYLVSLFVFWMIANSWVFALTIQQYDANIVLSEDGMIDVVETLRFEKPSKNDDLSIEWPMLTEYYVMGKRLPTSIDILSVTQNGTALAFETRREGRFIEIYTNLADNAVDKPLDKDTYAVRIHWQGKNYVYGLRDHDVLYLNVIKGQPFKTWLKKGIIALTLPPSVKVIESASHYGWHSSSMEVGKAALSLSDKIYFYTDQSFQYGNSFAISANFTKGVVSNVELSKADYLMAAILSYCWDFIEPIHIVVLFVALIMAMYLWIVHCTKTTLNNFSQNSLYDLSFPTVPLDKTFALVQTELSNQQLDRGNFALLADLNAKRFFNINRETSILTVEHYEYWQYSELTEAQQAFLKRLSSTGRTKHNILECDKDISDAMACMRDKLAEKVSLYQKLKFSMDKLLGLVLFGGLVWASNQFLDWVDYLVLLIPMLVSLKVIVPTISNRNGRSISYRDWAKMILVVIIGSIPIFILESQVTAIDLSWMGIIIFYATLLIPTVVLALIIHKILLPTWVVLDEYQDDYRAIMVFKQFLKQPKESDFDRLTPDIFEKYFPYAIVLEVDYEWLRLYRQLHPNHYHAEKLKVPRTTFSELAG